MATKPEAELRQEIADERRELANAVESLRGELDRTAERGKQIGTAVGAVVGTLVAVRTALRIKRRFRD
jgi:hypothetical protein